MLLPNGPKSLRISETQRGLEPFRNLPRSSFNWHAQLLLLLLVSLASNLVRMFAVVPAGSWAASSTQLGSDKIEGAGKWEIASQSPRRLSIQE